MACQVSAMTSCLHDICARLHRRAWFHRRAAHGASRCRCASAPGLMGTQENHQTETSGDLEMVEGIRGANWASLDPGRRSWCCFRSVLVGAAVVSRGNSAHNALDSGLGPRESAQCRRRLLSSSPPRPGSGGPSRSTPSSGLQLRSCLQFSLRDGAVRASISPTHRGPLGRTRLRFCQSSSSGRSRIRFAAFRTVSSTDMQNSFGESDTSTRRRWMLLSLSRQLAACTAGRPAGAWSVISWMCWVARE